MANYGTVVAQLNDFLDGLDLDEQDHLLRMMKSLLRCASDPTY